LATCVYVDGFNLYYGALKGTPYRWLNVAELCRLMLKGHDIQRIKYFTARVKSRPNDPDQHVRQQIYLRALATIPHLAIIEGSFLTKKVRARLVAPITTPTGVLNTVSVYRTEEKGSDVNLATHLVNDGHRGLFDTAVLITNDSDILEAIKIVRNELHHDVGILNPHVAQPSVELRRHASFMHPIRKGVPAASQFSLTLTDAVGPFHKPANW
jgi:uncharacterized LabA/DUF88 family protein